MPHLSLRGALATVAVGTGLAASPPRRSRRAAFPHRAPVSGNTVAPFEVWVTYAVTQQDRAGTCATLVRFCARCAFSQPVSPRPDAFPPSAPPPIARPCSRTSSVLCICPTSRDRASPASVLRPSRRGPAGHSPAGQSRDLPGSDAFLCSVMCSPTPAERQPLAWRDRTCCLRRCLPSRPLRPWVLRGSIAHPTASLCTLRSRRHQRLRNTRYRAPATAYPHRTCTGWTAPAFLAHKQSPAPEGLLRRKCS